MVWSGLGLSLTSCAKIVSACASVRVLVAHHHVEHDALPCFGRGEVREEIEIGRPLRDAGEQRRFGLCQVGGVLAEVDLAGRLRPVGPVAVVEQVEVHLQQLVFAEEVGQLLSQPGLEHFAIHRLVVALIRPQEEVAGELHGDRAGAGGDFAFLRVAQRGRGDARRIDAGVLVERGIFGGDGGVDQVLGDAVEADPGAPPLIPQLGDGRAVAVVETGGLEEARFGAGLVARQIRLDRADRVRRGPAVAQPI